VAAEDIMIAVIFEFTPLEGRFADYRALAEGLAADVRNFDGFLSIERFESITQPGKFVSLSFWRDEEAVRRWRNLQHHREAQRQGRGGIFGSYRLRVAQVLRDYTMDERAQTPEDSVKVHG
jgi:heme-degrading monooxygenase HmoA